MDQTGEQVGRVSDRASHIADQARSVVDDATDLIHSQQNHTLRNVLSFAAGVGVGVGAGILLAPSSGSEIRGTISDRVQDISEKVKGRVSTHKYPTGTE